MIDPQIIAENTEDPRLREMRLARWRREQERIAYEQRKFELEQRMMTRVNDGQGWWKSMMRKAGRL